MCLVTYIYVYLYVLRYLVFFDDGYVSYLHEDKLRIVWDQSDKFWSDLDGITRNFFQDYLTKYPNVRL